MARLVVLRFEHDDDAELYVESVREDRWPSATVEGMFQTPTKFHGDHPSSGWRYSEKHGWWICRDCGAPSIGYGENIKAVIFDATNLLELPSKNTLERIPTDPKVNPETGEQYGGDSSGDSSGHSSDNDFSGPSGKRFSSIDDGAYSPGYHFHRGRAVTEVSLPADDSRENDSIHPVHGDGERDIPPATTETPITEAPRSFSPIVAWPASRDE